MIVKCGVNGETLDESRISVCHHCGMPVCEEHGWVVAPDDAFAGATAAGLGPAGSLLRATSAAPLPAMHCRDCVDKFHAGAPKRHGWVDGRPAALGMASW